MAVNPGFELEKKSENTLDRLSAHANPRTNERVAKGSTFELKLKYDVEVILDEQGNVLLGNTGSDTIQNYWQFVAEDLNHILDALVLIEYSSLGGNGSRGYGKVSFNDIRFDAKSVFELLGEPAPEVDELETPINFSTRNDKFNTQRNTITEILQKFNGTYTKIKQTLPVMPLASERTASKRKTK